jgi:hypothetical protein
MIIEDMVGPKYTHPTIGSFSCILRSARSCFCWTAASPAFLLLFNGNLPQNNLLGSELFSAKGEQLLTSSATDHLFTVATGNTNDVMNVTNQTSSLLCLMNPSQ